MTLAEINPLARLADGSFVALDAHMEMEDEAVGRHKKMLEEIGVDLDEPRELYEPSDFERNVKAIDAADHRGVIQGKDHGFTGNLGLVIGAGGGSLTLTDAVRSQGGKPANYAEIGGNPSVAKSKGLAMEVLKKDGVEKIAVMMSIVSNTRVDIVARGVIKACLELGKDPAETIASSASPAPGRRRATKILDKYGIEFARPHHLDVGGGRRCRREDPGDAEPSSSNEDFTFIVQGITGREAVNLTRECLDFGSKIVGGVTPGRKGREVHGVPVFDTVEQVGRAPRLGPRRRRRHRPPRLHQGRGARGDRERHQADRDRHRADPARATSPQMVELANERGARIIGPNCLGLIVPGRRQDGRHRRPRQGRREGLRARQRRRDVALGRDDDRDLLDARPPPASASRPRSRSAATRSSAPPTPS